MSGAMPPLRHTRRQQELHLYTAVCIDMRKKLNSAIWIGHGFNVQRQHCASISARAVMAVLLWLGSLHALRS